MLVLTWGHMSTQEWELRHFIAPSIQMLITIIWGAVALIGLIGIDRLERMVFWCASRCLERGQQYVERHPSAQRWLDIWSYDGDTVLSEREQRQFTKFTAWGAGAAWCAVLNYGLLVFRLSPSGGLSTRGWIIGALAIACLCAIGAMTISKVFRLTFAIDPRL